MALELLALAAALEGEPERAAVLDGYADIALRVAGYERQHTETITFNRLRARLAEMLPPHDLSRRLAEGAALTPEAAIALALAEAPQ